MDGITEDQLRSAKLWETTDRKNTALVQVLKQACARNKAIEKQQLWEQKDREDNGSASSVSLKGRDGSVRTVARVPAGAHVTDNSTNRYAEERAKNADKKEDVQLERFCDGNDVAWRPDTFFTEVCGEDDVPPWPIRPTELFTNPHIVMKIMAQQMEKKKQKKLEKKARKAEKIERKKEKGSKKDKAASKAEKRKGKKSKRARNKKSGKKKDKGRKDRKARKRKRKASSSSSSSTVSSDCDRRDAVESLSAKRTPSAAEADQDGAIGEAAASSSSPASAASSESSG
mmetsp:Transcript_76810/g.221943  ORF Transcript_76810/g.221943 Transcript_76810/m.221943 type:complete len:286 (+) Transcript_76810:152-1009(+)